MSITDEQSGTGPDPRSVPVPARLRGGAGVRVQPAPSAAARIVPTGGIGIARDRLRVRSRYGERFRRAMAVAEQVLPDPQPARRHQSDRKDQSGRKDQSDRKDQSGRKDQSDRKDQNGGKDQSGRKHQGPVDPWGRFRDDRVSALADLAAVHLYLTGEWAWLDEALPEGAVGAHLPLARCVASGLRRLRVHRGPAFVRSSVVGPVTDWYRHNRVVTEGGFWAASASPAALREGGPGFLVWSLTARRTAAIDPYAPDRVVFLPGTRFKVLRVTEGPRPAVLMRELFPEEAAEDDPGAFDGGGTPWLDESTVEELDRAVSTPRTAAEPAVLAPVGNVGPPGRLPGLIVTAEAEARTGR